MLKIFPKYLNFENILKKCIRVPWPLELFKKQTNKTQYVKMRLTHFNMLNFICQFFI